MPWRAGERVVETMPVAFMSVDANCQITYVNPAYYELLLNLSEAPDRSAWALATAVRSSTSRLSHAISRMEDCGWVRREAHPTDRRATFAVLTDDGRAALANAAPGHVNAVREHLLRRLSPEQLDQLIDISRAIDPAVERTSAV